MCYRHLCQIQNKKVNRICTLESKFLVYNHNYNCVHFHLNLCTEHQKYNVFVQIIDKCNMLYLKIESVRGIVFGLNYMS